MDMSWVGLQYTVQNLDRARPQTKLHNGGLLSRLSDAPFGSICFKQTNSSRISVSICASWNNYKRLKHVIDARVKNSFMNKKLKATLH